MGPLDGQVALVTGASRGIGADIARVLAEQGARVVITARTMNEGDFHIPGSLQQTTESINAVGGTALAVPCDLGADDAHAALSALVARTVETFGRIDLLVNNAAIATPGTIETARLRHLDLSWRINVWAPILLYREVLAHFREQGTGGAVINISSGASRGPGAGPYTKAIAGGTTYGYTKAALERFTQGAAAELAGSGISVNALSPAVQIYVGGTVYVTQTDPAFSVADLKGRRKDGRIMGDACVEIATADHDRVTGRIYTDESALTDLAGLTDFSRYETF